MIELKVEEYCHDCPRFDPETVKLYGDNHCAITQVQCDNKTMCAHLVRYLRQQIEKEKKET